MRGVRPTLPRPAWDAQEGDAHVAGDVLALRHDEKLGALEQIRTKPHVSSSSGHRRGSLASSRSLQPEH
jgi:hypothetical protein